MPLPDFLSTPTPATCSARKIGVILIHVAFQSGFCTFVLSNYMKTTPEGAQRGRRGRRRRRLGSTGRSSCRCTSGAGGARPRSSSRGSTTTSSGRRAAQNQGADRPITSSIANLGGQFFTDDNLIAAGLDACRPADADRVLGAAEALHQRPDARREQGLSVRRPAVASSTSASDSTSFVDRSRRRRRGAWSTGAPPSVHSTATTSPRRPLRRRGRRPSARLDVVAPIAVVPEHGIGLSRPARPARPPRRRAGVVAALRARARRRAAATAARDHEPVDAVAGLRLVTTRRARTPAVTVRIEVTLTNDGDDRYLLDALDVTLAVPDARRRAADVPRALVHASSTRRRRPFGRRRVHRREPARAHVARAPAAAVRRHGRASASGGARCGAPTWRGAATTPCRRRAAARRPAPCVQLGELLHPGEVVLAPGESYRTPPVVRRPLRRRSRRRQPAVPRRRAARRHPATPAPGRAQHLGSRLLRPRLRHPGRALAERAAADRRRAVRARRRVVRRPSRRHGAGSATGGSSPDAHPDGLAPLIEHVRALGMEFGIWVEPEMVNPDSDLYRAHPEWALVDPGYEPVLGRNQLVLDLANADAYAEVLGRLDALLGDHDIAFVKWDMNRDHMQAHRRRPAGPARTPRRSRCTRCSTSCARAIPASRSRAARRAGRGSTSASSPAPSGCGRATATTRWSAR